MTSTPVIFLEKCPPPWYQVDFITDITFSNNLCDFINYCCLHATISIFWHTKQTRQIEIHQLQFHVCKFTQVQKVMPMGCVWWISISLVCLVRWKMYAESYVGFVEGDDSDKIYGKRQVEIDFWSECLKKECIDYSCIIETNWWVHFSIISSLMSSRGGKLHLIWL